MGTSIPDGPSVENEYIDYETSSINPRDRGDGIYRPPKLAPAPYPVASTKNTRNVIPAPNALATLAYLDATQPHAESASGLGGNASGINGSRRAREIARMTEFEEENFTRLVMNKKEAKRRARDEADIALGGVGITDGRRRSDGLAEEFRDVLRSREGKRKAITSADDGYEQLRQRGKKRAVLERSRANGHDWDISVLSEESKKKTRLDREANVLKRRMKKTARR
jgi:U3 small nucleolar ribonucleoprotein protein LCP5